MSDFGAITGVFNSASFISLFELIVLIPMFFLCKTKKAIKVKPVSIKVKPVSIKVKPVSKKPPNYNSTSPPTTASTTYEDWSRRRKSLNVRNSSARERQDSSQPTKSFPPEAVIVEEKSNIFDTFEVKDLF